MNELVFKINEKPVTNSLILAEKFGKRHADVIRSIESALEVNAKLRSHCVSDSYKDEQGKDRPFYILDRDGFTFVTMGFTGEKAAAFKWEYLEAFNSMESMLTSDDYILMRSREILEKKVTELSNKNLLLEDNLKKAEPAINFTESVTCSGTNILIRDLAKLISQNGIDIGEVRLYDWMVANKYLIRTRRWSKSKKKYLNDYMPTQKAANLKVFFVSETVICTGNADLLKHSVKVTGKGQVYFMNKFINNNYNQN